VPARLINIKYITIRAEKAASPVTALHRDNLNLVVDFYAALRWHFRTYDYTATSKNFVFVQATHHCEWECK